MALAPHPKDPHRRKELKRKKADPASFNAEEQPARERKPYNGVRRYGRLKHQAIMQRSQETGESFQKIAQRNEHNNAENVQ